MPSAAPGPPPRRSPGRAGRHDRAGQHERAHRPGAGGAARTAQHRIGAVQQRAVGQQRLPVDLDGELAPVAPAALAVPAQHHDLAQHRPGVRTRAAPAGRRPARPPSQTTVGSGAHSSVPPARRPRLAPSQRAGRGCPGCTTVAPALPTRSTPPGRHLEVERERIAAQRSAGPVHKVHPLGARSAAAPPARTGTSACRGRPGAGSTRQPPGRGRARERGAGAVTSGAPRPARGSSPRPARRPGARAATAAPSAGRPRTRLRVAAHHREVGADQRRQVGLVDHQQVGAGDAGPALARHLVAAGHVDHEDLPVDQARAERGGQVVAAALHQHQVERAEPRLQLLDRVQVGGDVVADGGVRAAAGLHRADPVVGQHARAGAGSRRPRWCRCRW